MSSLPDFIKHTYILLLVGIGTYLTGTFVALSIELSILAIIASFILLFCVIFTNNIIAFLIFTFTIGLSHHHFFEKMNMIDPFIIQESSIITFVIFGGLTIFALTSATYTNFLFKSILHIVLSSLILISLINIFVRNTFIEVLIIYSSIVIFSVFVVIDTQKILETGYKHPVKCALELFLDFINIFVNITRMMLKIKKKD